MVLPIRAKNPPESFPWVTCVLIALNTLVFIIVNIPAGGFFWSLSKEVGENYGLSYSNASPLTFVTSMFLHGDVFHLLGNMWFLYLFGFAVEGRMGWWKFAILYMLAGFAGDALQTGLFGAANPDVPSIGASGAIMGAIGAAVWIFPHAKIQVFYWFGILFRGIFDCPMWGIALFYIGGDVFWAVLSTGLGSGVAHLAHIGGAVGGLILAAIFRIRRDSAEASEAKATLADAKDMSVLSALELKDMAQSQPENTEITIHWIMKVIKNNSKLEPELLARFKRHAPKLVKEDDPGAVGWVLLNIPPEPDVRPSWLLETAVAAEKQGSPQMAQQLYQRVFHMPHASEADQEAAAFKNAMLMEAWFQNYAGAEDLYRWILQRWPMTPMEGQVKARLAVVGPRAEQQRRTAQV